MAIAAAGPLAFLANELGWLVSELGRQPWIVYGVFRTSSGITTAPGLGRDVHRVHAALHRPDRADGLGACGESPRKPIEDLPAGDGGGMR